MDGPLLSLMPKERLGFLGAPFWTVFSIWLIEGLNRGFEIRGVGFRFVLHSRKRCQTRKSKPSTDWDSALNRAMPVKKRADTIWPELDWCFCVYRLPPLGASFTQVLTGKKSLAHSRIHTSAAAKSRAKDGFLVERGDSAHEMFPELEEISEAESRNAAEFLSGHTHRLCCLDSPWWYDR